MFSDKLMEVLSLLPQATLETVIMTFASTILASFLGFPLGTYLFVTSPSGIAPK